MSTTTEFGTQLIGRTEKALNAILERQLAGTGLTEAQWVTLTLAVRSGGTIDRTVFVTRVAGALKITGAEAQARIGELVGAQLLELPREDGTPVTATDQGRQLHARISTNVAAITQRLWGDLAAADLAIAARILGTVLERANAELAST